MHHDKKAPHSAGFFFCLLVTLAVSLTSRFIAVVVQTANDVRDAQWTWDIEKNRVAPTVTVIVRMLKTGDDVADAIEARSFD